MVYINGLNVKTETKLKTCPICGRFVENDYLVKVIDPAVKGLFGLPKTIEMCEDCIKEHNGRIENENKITVQ